VDLRHLYQCRILIVHPKIMESSGNTFNASLVATVISAFLGPLIMGIYAKPSPLP